MEFLPKNNIEERISIEKEQRKELRLVTSIVKPKGMKLYKLVNGVVSEVVEEIIPKTTNLYKLYFNMEEAIMGLTEVKKIKYSKLRGIPLVLASNLKNATRKFKTNSNKLFTV